MLFHTTHDLDAEGPLLVLTHGAGGHADLWTTFRQVLSERTRLPILAVDLAGHGRSPRQADYSVPAQAAAVGRVVDATLAAHFTSEHPVVHVGHSMGGMVGLLDAAVRANVPAVFCCSTKWTWSERERAGLARMASSSFSTYPAQERAVRKHLALTGLAEVLDPADPTVAAGVHETPHGWSPTQDPGIYQIGPTPVATWRAAAQARGTAVHWGVGAEDPLVPVSSLTPVLPTVFPRARHNPHIETPRAVTSWVLDKVGLPTLS